MNSLSSSIFVPKSPLRFIEYVIARAGISSRFHHPSDPPRPKWPNRPTFLTWPPGPFSLCPNGRETPWMWMLNGLFECHFIGTKSSPTRPTLDLDPRAARGRPSTVGSGLLSSASCLLSPARLSSWPDLPWPTGFASSLLACAVAKGIAICRLIRPWPEKMGFEQRCRCPSCCHRWVPSPSRSGHGRLLPKPSGQRLGRRMGRRPRRWKMGFTACCLAPPGSATASNVVAANGRRLPSCAVDLLACSSPSSVVDGVDGCWHQVDLGKMKHRNWCSSDPL
ncbi:hypothetical protein ACLOJK_024347 [Asimina triloba]